MQNIEYKAELRDVAAARAQCKVIGAEFKETLVQTDIYYKLADGRLKRRETEGKPIEWIYYHRPNRITACISSYMRYTDEQARARWGFAGLREWITVKKTRQLYLLDNVRIHLDEVEDLGTFIEFEAVVDPIHHSRVCRGQVAQLCEAFRPIMGEAVAVGYSDLIEQAASIKTPDDPGAG